MFFTSEFHFKKLVKHILNCALQISGVSIIKARFSSCTTTFISTKCLIYNKNGCIVNRCADACAYLDMESRALYLVSRMDLN